jgi:hypothetical protein
MKLTDFYTKACNGCMFAMMSLQMQIVVGENDTDIVVVYFNPTEQGVATKFIRFVKKYANHTKKTVKICTGGDDLGLQRDTPLCENYHRKVTYWLMKEGFVLKKVKSFEDRWFYKNAHWKNYYAMLNMLITQSNPIYAKENQENLKDSDYLNIPCYAVKAWLEYTP